MGACFGPKVDANTRSIDSHMSKDHKKTQYTNKLLFLGPGRSGKSTIFRQLQWLHGKGFSKKDCLLLRRSIYYQVISQMKDILEYYSLTSSDDSALRNAISLVTNNGDHHALSQELARAIQYIWDDQDMIRNAFTDPNVSKYQVLDETTEYFWDDLDRIMDPKYVPTETDIINLRYRTTGVEKGVVEKQFAIGKVKFHIVDVGGQKSERKKWIHCFNEVTALLFVISLSCYNEMMYENKSKNCMVDSLELFDQTINSKWFTKTHIILFLNKKDLFRKKIRKYPITVCAAFDDFNDSDPNSYDQTTRYIQNKFSSLNGNKYKTIYQHLTYAMNRKNIDTVFNDITHVITSYTLGVEGLA